MINDSPVVEPAWSSIDSRINRIHGLQGFDLQLEITLFEFDMLNVEIR